MVGQDLIAYIHWPERRYETVHQVVHHRMDSAHPDPSRPLHIPCHDHLVLQGRLLSVG